MGKYNKSKGEVSDAAKKELGEDLAEMFNNIGKKLYAGLKEKIKVAIADSISEHKDNLQDAVQQEFGRRGLAKAEKYTSEWLNEVIGSAIYSVMKEAYEDLDSIAESMLAEDEEEEEEEKPKQEKNKKRKEDDDEDDDEEEGEEEEDQDVEDEEEEEEEEEEDKVKKEGSFSDMRIKSIKNAALKIASDLQRKGDIESAAIVKTAVSNL